jgi:hypothetical protein
VTVEIEISQCTAKLRRPWAVALLSVATLGIYWPFWYYKINREMRDYGSSREDRVLSGSEPVRSGLAVSIGRLLIIPAIVSFIGAIGRLRRVERLASGRSRSGAVLIVLLVGGELLSLGPSGQGPWLAVSACSYSAYIAASMLIQSRLNAVWRATRADRSDVEPSELACSRVTALVDRHVEGEKVGV